MSGINHVEAELVKVEIGNERKHSLADLRLRVFSKYAGKLAEGQGALFVRVNKRQCLCNR